jgi:hypothetical protein
MLSLVALPSLLYRAGVRWFTQRKCTIRQRSLRRHFRKLCALAACLSVAALGLVLASTPGALAQTGNAPPQQPPGGVALVKTSPLDEPLKLMAEAMQNYQRVQDYTCTLVKQERINGKLQPEHLIEMKFRKQPFSVCMKWQLPRNMVGQQVCYVAGKNNGMMRVHSTGILGVVGFVSISPQDPRVLEHSRHMITEAGFGNLLSRCYNDWSQERNQNRVNATVAEYNFNGARCYRIEVAFAQRVAQAYCYRSVLFLDKQTKLPVRAECYDWPSQGGPPGGELFEVFSYLNTRFNVGLTEKDFNY